MLVDVDFQASLYGTEVARILSLEVEAARAELKGGKAADLFPDAFSPEGALCGLHLHFSLIDEAHKIAQDLNTAEGSFWHGIVHRREPDAANAAYWFRKVGRHPIFPTLRDEARRLRFDTGAEWNPFEFIEFCESARVRPGSDEEDIAMRVQLAEWQMLFDYCARGEIALSEVRAAVLEAFNQPLVIRNYPDPGEPAAGEALVAVEIAGICGTDVHLWLGQMSIPLPNIMGHESAGRIEKMGAVLERDWLGEPLQIGDRVAWASSISCGECFYCRVKRQPTRCLTRKAYGISYCASDAPHLRGGYAEKFCCGRAPQSFEFPMPCRVSV